MVGSSSYVTRSVVSPSGKVMGMFQAFVQTHVRFVAKTSQCTGGPAFQGDQDAGKKRDEVGAKPVVGGFRGALLLKAGHYVVAGSLRMSPTRTS